MSICFLLIRKVLTPYFDNYWIEAYKSIRKFYPDTHIKIIDNNSTCASTIPLVNCDIIQAEYPESRIFSPYYEFLKIDGYSKAIILHDGFIFNSYIDFTKITNVKFIWHFETHDYDDTNLITTQINTLENGQPLLDLYFSKEWYGCLGSLIVIDKSFITLLEEKYKISKLVNVIKNQADAIAFERVIALLCYYEYPDLKDNLSIEGDIKNMIWGYTYADYVADKSPQMSKPFFKLFGARV
jgi:hypothetical protein